MATPITEETLRKLHNLVTTQGFEFLLKIAGRERLNNELNAEGMAFYDAIWDLAEAGHDIHKTRLEANGVEVNDSDTEQQEVHVAQPSFSFNSMIPAIEIVQTGIAFKGDPNKVAYVPVTMEPVLYESKDGRWSWRTKVVGHNDFRHVNVSNFYAKAKDANGQWYAIVDLCWKTTQPVFVDFCNRA